jgi:hypothetical protein
MAVTSFAAVVLLFFLFICWLGCDGSSDPRLTPEESIEARTKLAADQSQQRQLQQQQKLLISRCCQSQQQWRRFQQNQQQQQQQQHQQQEQQHQGQVDWTCTQVECPAAAGEVNGPAAPSVAAAAVFQPQQPQPKKQVTVPFQTVGGLAGLLKNGIFVF